VLVRSGPPYGPSVSPSPPPEANASRFLQVLKNTGCGLPGVVNGPLRRPDLRGYALRRVAFQNQLDDPTPASGKRLEDLLDQFLQHRGLIRRWISFQGVDHLIERHIPLGVTTLTLPIFSPIANLIQRDRDQ